jgi:hypothetical protein
MGVDRRQRGKRTSHSLDQWRDRPHPRQSISTGVGIGAASAIAQTQTQVVAWIEVEIVDIACIGVRGIDDGIGGVKLRCSLVYCIVVSERRSVPFVRAVHKEEYEGKGGERRRGAHTYGKRGNQGPRRELDHFSARVKVVEVWPYASE